MSIPQNENNSIELYMASVCGKEVQLPEPRTRLELFFAKWAGMDVTLPVDYHEGTVTFEPTQEGSGDPSPENVRPILPGLTFTRDDGTTLTVYGGTLDVLSGILTVTWSAVDLSSLSWRRRYTGTIKCSVSSTLPYSYNMREVSFLIEKYRYIGNVSSVSGVNAPDNRQIGVRSYYNSESGTVTDNIIYLIRDLSDTESGSIVFTPNTPKTYQLTSTEVSRALEALGYYSINTRAEYCLLAAMKKVDPPSNSDSRFVNFVRWGLGVGEEPVGTHTRFERYLREWATQQLS